jgi:G:T-mismatch repair DNA endonuclease (very short patch repair protein)
MKCPFCGEEKSVVKGGHLRSCAKSHGFGYLTIKEKRYEFLIYNFPKYKDKEVFEEDYSKMSLPDFSKKEGLDSNQVLFLCSWYNIKKRSISEAANLISKDKYKETCLEKYGTTNALSKGTPVYEKRNNSVKEKYGVSNVFQIPEVINWIQSDDIYLERYGISRHDFVSKNGKKVWGSLSEDSKVKWLENSIWSKKHDFNSWKSGFNSSKLEILIGEALLSIGLNIETQFLLKTCKAVGHNKYNYYYDFFLKDFNTIIEINGDYWHGNPIKYKKGEYISFPWGKVLVDTIWERDKKKQEFAESKGLGYIILWEKDIIDNKAVLNEFLSNKLKEVLKNYQNMLT